MQPGENNISVIRRNMCENVDKGVLSLRIKDQKRLHEEDTFLSQT